MSVLTRRRVEESAGVTFTEVEPDGWVTVHARGLGAVVSAASMSKLPKMALGYQLHSATFHVHVGPSLHKHTHHISTFCFGLVGWETLQFKLTELTKQLVHGEHLMNFDVGPSNCFRTDRQTDRPTDSLDREMDQSTDSDAPF